MFRVFTLIIVFLFVNAEKYTYASNPSRQLGSIDFPAPNKKIEKIIPNENFKVIK